MFDDQTERLFAHRTVEFCCKIEDRQARFLMADQRGDKRRITGNSGRSRPREDTADLFGPGSQPFSRHGKHHHILHARTGRT